MTRSVSTNLPRHLDGTLQSRTVLGGYPFAYLAQFEWGPQGGEWVLCPGCARGVDADSENMERVVHAFVNFEDPHLYCECGERIPSAYAEDEHEDLG